MSLLRTVVVVGCFMVFGISLTMAENPSDVSRDEIVARQLDCVAQHYDPKQPVVWADVCYTQPRSFVRDASIKKSEAFEIAKVPEVRVRTRSLESRRFDIAQADRSSAKVTLDEAGNVSIEGNVVNAEEPAAIPDDEEEGEEYEPEEDLGPVLTEEQPVEEPLAEVQPVKEKGSFWRLDPIFRPDNPLTDYDFGLEAFSYEYREDELMNLEGYMMGVNGAFTYRTSLNEHIKSFKDIFSATNTVNMFRLEGRFSYGKMDYSSYGTGQDDDIPNWAAEIRGLVGYDVPVMAKSRITPYLGLGYRYLFDDQGGTTTSTGNWGYDRESRYVYFSAGMESEFPLKGAWSLGFTVEYDHLIDGEQTSHLEDGGVGLDSLDNDQNEGYGLRGAVRLKRTADIFEFYLEPFIRYWNIENSEVSVITSGGVPVSEDGDYVLVGLEPKNDTTEIGVKMGLKF